MRRDDDSLTGLFIATGNLIFKMLAATFVMLLLTLLVLSGIPLWSIAKGRSGLWAGGGPPSGLFSSEGDHPVRPGIHHHGTRGVGHTCGSSLLRCPEVFVSATAAWLYCSALFLHSWIEPFVLVALPLGLLVHRRNRNLTEGRQHASVQTHVQES